MAQGEIRIIGGSMRGRKIKVPDVPDLRPTPDRVRETLFNWLAQTIQGAYCLDPFAGSGALGFEAISRGAKHMVMVEESKKAVLTIKEELSLFKIPNAEVYYASAPHGILPPKNLFDIVFLDPPFEKNLLLPTCFFLEENNYLAKKAVIYLESKNTLEDKDLPLGWKMIKSKKAGQVNYHLAKKE